METDKLLRQLLDREQIRELIHRYCYAVDARDLSVLGELFDDHCTLEIRHPGEQTQRCTGKSPILEFHRRNLNRDFTFLRHTTSNHIIEVKGDEASCKCYWNSALEFDGGAVSQSGRFMDRLRRVADAWKITERVTLIEYVAPFKHGWG
jgi:ketosteroid isomerase-like protein